MHLVPLVPQPRVGVEDRLEVPKVAAVKAAEAISERSAATLPEHGLKHLHHPPPMQQEKVQRERRKLQDRRLACRRFHHLPVLEELRSLIDRRHRTRRATDVPAHIDVEV